MEKDILFVFEFWNDLDIIKHREISKFRPTIKARLEFYKVSELCQAMRNYKDILKSEDHFWSYAWTLKEFLTRTNGLDTFLDRESALLRFKNIEPRQKLESDSVDFYHKIDQMYPDEC